MFLITGITFLVLLSLTLLMLWGHEKIRAKRIITRARIEDFWDGEERREHERFPHDLEVEYNVEKKPHLKRGTSVDISKGGMKLFLDEKLPKGAIVDLKLSTPDNKKTIEIEAEIVWTSDADVKDSSGKRFFHSGLKFIAVKESSGTHLSEYISNLTNETAQHEAV